MYCAIFFKQPDNDVITASSPPDSIFYHKTTSSPSGKSYA